MIDDRNAPTRLCDVLKILDTAVVLSSIALAKGPILLPPSYPPSKLLITATVRFMDLVCTLCCAVLDGDTEAMFGLGFHATAEALSTGF